MDFLTVFLTAVIVIILLALGLVIGWLIGTTRARAAAAVELAEARTARRMLAERTSALEADARLATEVTAAVGPLAAGVKSLQSSLGEQDRSRLEQLTRLDEQITRLAGRSEELQRSTRDLTGALHSTATRGDWGEVQLRRIVEYAGMIEHVDFDVQVTGRTDSGTVRPDLVVRLPDSGSVVIDAKAPLTARLADDGSETDHAWALRRHVAALSSKEYWAAFEPAPQFVVCFVPTDGLLSAACAADAGLVDRALSKNVVLASPSTLLVLLKTVALNWRQYELSTSAQEITALGRQLYARVGTLSANLTKLGTSLDRAAGDYNAFVGSFENRFLVTARKLESTGVADESLAPVRPVDALTRTPSAGEFDADRHRSAM